MVREVPDASGLRDRSASQVIRGLETARWGAGRRENSALGALAAALAAAGRADLSYSFLMGVSGAAFRVQVLEPGWCPSAPHARCGFDCLDAAFAALPYERVDLPSGRDDPEAVARVKRALTDSIDRGLPAFYSGLEESLIVGYRNGGDELLLRPYAARTAGYASWFPDGRASADAAIPPESLVSDWPHLCFAVLRPKAEPPERRAGLLRSLAIAVELAHTRRYDRYSSGFAALESWIAGLRDRAGFDALAAGERARRMRANAHCYFSYADARDAAHAYLRQIAGELGGAAAAPLARAAGGYEAIARDVLKRRRPAEVAPMRLAPAAWTQEQREAQAELLEEALALEREAVAQIEAARAAS